MGDEVGELISDGKRMRLVWQPDDGDGDPAAHLVERSMNLVRGHPTWKVFVNEIPVPLVRGSKDEPPHYVYLDDRACYTVWCSKAYDHQELREFWPWDFNHQGHIKEGRMNRGYPAYLDDSCTEFAQGKLRRKGLWYTFHGAPDVDKYEPSRPRVPTKMEEEVAREYAGNAEVTSQGSNDDEAENARIPSKATPRKHLSLPDSIGTSKSVTTRGTPTKDFNTIDESIPTPTSRDKMLLERMFRPTLKTKTTPSNLPRSSAGYTYEHIYTPRGPDTINPKRSLNEATQKSLDQSGTPPSQKRTFVEPAEYDALPKKRLQKDSKLKPGGFGGDGANDEVPIFDPEDYYMAKHVKRGPSGFLSGNAENQVEALQRENDQLKRDVASLQAHIVHVTKQRNHYRRAIIHLTSTNLKQQNDLRDRIVAFQQFANSIIKLTDEFQDLATTAKEEIEPTCALSAGLGATLDGAGKYLYGQGMDEEWKDIHNEATRIAERQ